MNLVTGRKQLRLVNDSELRLMTTNEYRTFLSEHKILRAGSKSHAATVERVGERIAAAIQQYYDNKQIHQVLEGYAWEFNTVESKEDNAWCMPGGSHVTMVAKAGNGS